MLKKHRGLVPGVPGGSAGPVLEHMDKNFEINRTKIEGGCQLGRKVVTHNSKSVLPLKSDKTWRGLL